MAEGFGLKIALEGEREFIGVICENRYLAHSPINHLAKFRF